MKTIYINVTGKVQGVYFRQSTMEKARELGIGGTVSNENDGSVSILATGADHDLQELVSWCHHGPARARVQSVTVSPLEYRPLADFQIKR